MVLQGGMSSGFAFQFPWPVGGLRTQGGLWRARELMELFQLCDHRAIPKEKQRAKPHTKCKQLGHGHHPQSLGSHRGGLGWSQIQHGLQVMAGPFHKAKKTGGEDPTSGWSQGWAYQPCFLPHPPESPSRAFSPSLFQAPTGDGVPAAMANPGPASCWVRLSRRTGRGRGRTVTEGHRKERSTRLDRYRSCCPSSLQPLCSRGSPRFLVGGTDPHLPSHCRSARPW